MGYIMLQHHSIFGHDPWAFVNPQVLNQEGTLCESDLAMNISHLYYYR